MLYQALHSGTSRGNRQGVFHGPRSRPDCGDVSSETLVFGGRRVSFQGRTTIAMQQALHSISFQGRMIFAT